ncbi:Ger(x)C family spore germination protein [Paenibacillus lycopersici]|uniref:Ger(X)C family spore germination protein n=1 Tax=Paenibacillus lycopersici TaxID=2704462 RepID=A0A6C0G1R2_9BACL|nr:Ger(x)C family spore germination protein [Paenibacillus lycopersici]QHT61159.1 Ger(x)C family spore germination protein [Paenibacillus lycopersici]
MKPLIRGTLFLLALFVCFPMQGCSDLKEINDMAIADMVGVDMDEEGHYMAYYQIINPNGVAGSKSGGSRSPLYTYAFQADSWAEFASTATRTIPRKLFISHYQAYIVSERLAAKGLDDLLNFLENDPTRRMATNVFIAKSPVQDIMNTFVPLERNPGKELRSVHELQHNVASTASPNSQIKTLLENYEGTKLSFISNIRVVGKPMATTKRFETIQGDKGNFELFGSTIIKQGKRVGELTPDQMASLLFVRGEAHSLIEPIETDNQEAAELQLMGQPRIKRQLTLKNNRLELRIHIHPKLKLASIDTNGRIDTATLHRLEKLFDERMAAHSNALLQLGKKNHWDLIDIQDQIMHKNGKRWHKLKASPESWEGAKITIDVHAKIIKTGVIMTPYTRS